MIALSNLPKNSRGIIKLVNTTGYSQQELTAIGLTVGTKIKIKHVINSHIVFEACIEDRKERANIPIHEALKVLVLPI